MHSGQHFWLLAGKLYLYWYSTQARVKLMDTQRCHRTWNLNKVSVNSGITIILKFQVKLKFNLCNHHLLHTIPLNLHNIIIWDQKPLNLHSIMCHKSTEYTVLLNCKFHALSHISPTRDKKSKFNKDLVRAPLRCITVLLISSYKTSKCDSKL